MCSDVSALTSIQPSLLHRAHVFIWKKKKYCMFSVFMNRMRVRLRVSLSVHVSLCFMYSVGYRTRDGGCRPLFSPAFLRERRTLTLMNMTQTPNHSLKQTYICIVHLKHDVPALFWPYNPSSITQLLCLYCTNVISRHIVLMCTIIHLCIVSQNTIFGLFSCYTERNVNQCILNRVRVRG